MKLFYKNMPDGTKKLVHMSFNDGKLFDETLEANEEDLECIIAENCVFDGEKVIVTEEQNKKKEARLLIETYFEQHDQINRIYEYIDEFHDILLTVEEKGILTKGTQMKEAKRYIKEILDEYQENGENADYTTITPPSE